MKHAKTVSESMYILELVTLLVKKGWKLIIEKDKHYDDRFLVTAVKAGDILTLHDVKEQQIEESIRTIAEKILESE